MGIRLITAFAIAFAIAFMTSITVSSVMTDLPLFKRAERAFGKSDREIIRDVLDFLSPGN
jgi:hypothetical protein